MKAIFFKKRIKGIEKIKEITFAMETISAIKMQKAQALFFSAKPFSEKALSILDSLLKSGFKPFSSPQTKTLLGVVVASDRGLCGAFNSKILKKAKNEIDSFIKKGFRVEIFAIGKKTKNFFEKRGYKIISEFFGIGDFGTMEETDMIAKKILELFEKKKFEKVFVFYNNFISSFIQKPVGVQLLPPSLETIKQILEIEIKKEPLRVDYLFEPSGEEVLKTLFPFLVRAAVYRIILETNAAEHSARMMAMRNAKQNAEDLSKKLLLFYNKLRQQEITREISEIQGAKGAME